MVRKYLFLIAIAGPTAGVIALVGCSNNSTASSEGERTAAQQSDSAITLAASSAASSIDGEEEHAHEAGAHGGIIVSLGRDSYHVEAVFEKGGLLHLYMLGSDETRIQEVDAQELTGYVKASDGNESVSFTIKAQPQPGDAAGKTSLFVAQLPDDLAGRNLDVTVPSIRIAGERFRLGFTSAPQTHDEHAEDIMPDKVADEAERELYLTPGGIYTQADIDANGNVTASEKFKSFMAKHDMHPKPGDKICPVTNTKANPACSWIVGGKKYEFCCPPCVDEFVSWAKNEETIKDIKDPEYYVKK
jgi:hypothetical protein